MNRLEKRSRGAGLKPRLRIQGLFLALILVILAGCARDDRPVTLPWTDEVPSNDIRLAAGDEIEVRFRYWPELDDTQTVLPDGTVSLPEIDSVEVAGLTVPELDAKLTKLYEPHLVDPVLTVVVRGIYDRRIYVGGEVARAGIVDMPGRMSVMEAIVEAGGFNLNSAQTDSVLVIRHVSGNRYVKLVDMKDSITSGEGSTFYLSPRDIVYVPETGVTKANRWVDQYINRMIPQVVAQAGFIIATDP